MFSCAAVKMFTCWCVTSSVVVEFSLVCLTKARSVLKRLSVWYRPVRGQSWIFSMRAVVAGFCLSICPCNRRPSSCECLFENNLRMDTIGMDMVKGEKTRDGVLAWLDLLNGELSLGAKPRLYWRGPTEIPGDGERGRHYYAVSTRMAPTQTAKTGIDGSRFDVSLIVRGDCPQTRAEAVSNRDPSAYHAIPPLGQTGLHEETQKRRRNEEIYNIDICNGVVW